MLYGEALSEENKKRVSTIAGSRSEGNSTAQRALAIFEADLKAYPANLHTWTLMLMSSSAETQKDGRNAIRYYEEASNEGCIQATSFLVESVLYRLTGYIA